MSLVSAPSVTPARKGLYHSPRGVYSFQADGVARFYASSIGAKFALWSTGIGKTHLAMISACMMIEDDLIDHVVSIAEIGKVLDWKEDWERFTDLSVGVYHGSKRKGLLADLPKVLVSTYETIKADGVVFKRQKDGKVNKRAKPEMGLLAEALQGKRVLWVYDEITAKLSSDRTSGNYIAHWNLLHHFRQWGARALGLSADSFERDPEGAFNIARLLMPTAPCTVEQFEKDHVVERNIYGKAMKFKNLTEDNCSPGVVSLTKKLAPLVMVKLKTDPDVVNEFPKQVEEATHVELSDKHYDFYERIESFFSTQDEMTQRVGYVIKRQIAGHPMSLLRSQGKFARQIVDLVGAQGLAAMGSKKTDEVVEYVRRRNHAGEQVVLFTFFGQSMLPLIHEALVNEKLLVSINHGQMSVQERQVSKNAFRSGDTGVFLSSDAGSRGLNLPEALVVVNYEFPITWSNYNQRVNRVHRIDSDHPSVTCMSFIADYTIEEPIANITLLGNESSDGMISDWNRTLLDDEDDGSEFLSAHARRQLLAIERKRKKRKSA